MFNINTRSTVFLLFLICGFTVFTSAMEVKIAATVNGEVISTQDIKNRQKIVEALNNGMQISEKDALSDIIRHNVYLTRANELGLQLPKEKLEYAINILKTQNIKSDLNSFLLEEYIKNELIAIELLDIAVRPRISISEDEVSEHKNKLIEKNDYKKLEQILENGKKIDLGWVGLDELSDNVKKAVEKTKVGGLSSSVDGKKYKILDEASKVILSSIFSLHQKMDKPILGIFKVKLSDLDRKSRNNLLKTNVKGVTQITRDNKSMKVEIINSNLDELLKSDLYNEKLELEQKKFFDGLLEGAAIIEK